MSLYSFPHSVDLVESSPVVSPRSAPPAAESCADTRRRATNETTTRAREPSVRAPLVGGVAVSTGAAVVIFCQKQFRGYIARVFAVWQMSILLLVVYAQTVVSLLPPGYVLPVSSLLFVVLAGWLAFARVTLVCHMCSQQQSVNIICLWWWWFDTLETLTDLRCSRRQRTLRSRQNSC
jgi:hypothetical protein